MTIVPLFSYINPGFHNLSSPKYYNVTLGTLIHLYSIMYCRLSRDGVLQSGPGTDESCQSGGADGVLPLSAAWTHEEGLPPETGIPGFWDGTVPVSSRTGDDTVCSSTARYRPEGPVSVSGSYTGTPHFTAGPRGQSMGRGRGRGPQAGTSGVQGVSTPSHRRLSQQISQLYRVRFCYLAYGLECYLILVLRIHSLLHQS